MSCDLKELRILVPAAGESRRYLNVGIVGPKGFIRFQNHGASPRTMIENAAMPYDLIQMLNHDRSRWIVGVQRHNMDSLERIKGAQMYSVGKTAGQSETLLRMIETMEYNDTPILVVNCDNGFDYPLSTFVRQATAFQAAALVFRSEEPHYSYVDGFPLFPRAFEKQAVSEWAMAGAYFFRSAALLREALRGQMAVDGRHSGEFYLSGAFQHLPTPDNLAVAIPRGLWRPWGTPEDLARDPYVRINDPDVEEVLRKLR